MTEKEKEQYEYEEGLRLWAEEIYKRANSTQFERTYSERSEFNKGGLMGVTDEDAKTLLKIIKSTFNIKGLNLSGIFNRDGKKITYDASKLETAILQINQLMYHGTLSKQDGTDLRALIYGYVAAISSKKPIYVKYAHKRQIYKNLHDSFDSLREDYYDQPEEKRLELEKNILIGFKLWAERGTFGNLPYKKISGDGIAKEIVDETGKIIANVVLIIEGNGGNMEATTAHEILGHALAKNFGIDNSALKLIKNKLGLEVQQYEMRYKDGNGEEIVEYEDVISHDVEAVKFENIIRRLKKLKGLKGLTRRDMEEEPHGSGKDRTLDIDWVQNHLEGNEIPFIVQPAFWNYQIRSKDSPFVGGTPMIIEQDEIEKKERSKGKEVKNESWEKQIKEQIKETEKRRKEKEKTEIEELKKQIKQRRDEIDALKKEIKEKVSEKEINALKKQIREEEHEIDALKKQIERIKKYPTIIGESQNIPKHNNSLLDTLSRINDTLYANNISNSSEDALISPLLWRGAGGEALSSTDQYQILPGTNCQITLTEEIQPDIDSLIADALISIFSDSDNVA